MAQSWKQILEMSNSGVPKRVPGGGTAGGAGVS